MTLDGVSDLIRFSAELGVGKFALNPVSPGTASMAPGQNLSSDAPQERTRLAISLVDEWESVANDVGITLIGAKRSRETFVLNLKSP
jgi:hypothetical protein